MSESSSPDITHQIERICDIHQALMHTLTQSSANNNHELPDVDEYVRELFGLVKYMTVEIIHRLTKEYIIQGDEDKIEKINEITSCLNDQCSYLDEYFKVTEIRE